MGESKISRAAKEYTAPEPGTRAAVEQIAAETGHGALPDRYTNEGIEAFNEGKDTSSVYIVASDYERDLQARASLGAQGSQITTPTDDIAAPYVAANPDRAFRWLTRQHMEKRGDRGYQPVVDKNGKKVTHLNDGRYLAHIPKDVRDSRLREYRERGNAARQALREETMENGRRMEFDTGGGIRVIPQSEMERKLPRPGRD